MILARWLLLIAAMLGGGYGGYWLCSDQVVYMVLGVPSGAGLGLLASMWALVWAEQLADERRRRATYRRVSDLPSSGAARVEGAIHGEPTLSTPLRGLSVFGYGLALESPPFGASSGYDNGPEKLLVEQLEPFWLDDGSGRVFVDTKAGPLRIQVSRPRLEPHDGVPTPALRAALKRAGADPNHWLITANLRAGEWALTGGARVRVDGWVRQEVDPGGQGGFRGTTTRPVLQGTKKHPLRVKIVAY